MTSDEPRVASRVTQYTPVTVIVPITGTGLALSGSGRNLELASLNSDQTTSQRQRWTIFERERIHRIVCDDGSRERRAIVLGGKEAKLVQLVLDSSDDPAKATLSTLCRFALDDFAGDAAFFADDRVLVSTLHNSILVFPIGDNPSSSTSAPLVPLFRPVTTIHAPARPLLWTSRFSQSLYDGRERVVRLAGGSLLGEVLVWDFDPRLLSDFSGDCGSSHNAKIKEHITGTLTRLNGHRGAIFTVAFSPESPELLASGSDDRTLRIWDLSPLSTGSPEPSKIIEKDARVLWGHEGRVWRIEWVDDARLVSVGEDATCRLWRLTSSDRLSPSAGPPYTLLKTWRDGHDGRSIWSVNIVRLEGDRESSIELAVTGGADGAIRSWILPSGLETALERPSASARTKKLEQGAQVKSFVVAADPETDCLVAVSLTNNGSFYLGDPTTSLLELKPFHSSPSFANTATSLHLSFESGDGAILRCFNNRGGYLFARFHRNGTTRKDASDYSLTEIVEHQFGIKAVSCTFDDRGTRLAIWERARWKIHVCSLATSPNSSQPPSINSAIDLTPSVDGSTAPTALRFLGDSHMLVGGADGRVSLHSLGPTGAEFVACVQVHVNGVSDLRQLPIQRAKATTIEIESVGRDGMRKVIEIDTSATTLSKKMTVVDERWIAKGTIEKILVRDTDEAHYLGLVDTRAAIFDSLGRLLYAFDSPAKQSSSQFIETRTRGSHFFCVVQGRLTQQQYGSGRTPSSLLMRGLHGREIRAVKALTVTLDGGQLVTILATAAENGALAISQLDHENTLRPLYVNRYLPSSLKSLVFATPVPSGSNSAQTTLYACGTRELLTAFEIDVVPSHGSQGGRDGSVEVRVRERGTMLADVDGGEVRTMDLALVDLDEQARFIVAGYSDGKLKIWKHDNLQFELIAETEGLSKCVLSVEVERIVVDGRERILVVSGQSDGLLSIRDLTSLTEPSETPCRIGDAALALSPHQSGINGLSVSRRDETLLVATAGDDNAVALHRVELSEVEGRLVAECSASSTLPDAHASTIQGLDFVSPTLIASSSVEQRLNFYSIQGLELVASTCLDVADCSAQDVVSPAGGEQGSRVIVAGIGVEVVQLSD